MVLEEKFRKFGWIYGQTDGGLQSGAERGTGRWAGREDMLVVWDYQCTNWAGVN